MKEKKLDLIIKLEILKKNRKFFLKKKISLIKKNIK